MAHYEGESQTVAIDCWAAKVLYPEKISKSSAYKSAAISILSSQIIKSVIKRKRWCVLQASNSNLAFIYKIQLKLVNENTLNCNVNYLYCFKIRFKSINWSQILLFITYWEKPQLFWKWGFVQVRYIKLPKRIWGRRILSSCIIKGINSYDSKMIRNKCLSSCHC